MRILVTIRVPDKFMEGFAYSSVTEEEWEVMPHSELHELLAYTSERAICRLVDKRAEETRHSLR